MSILLKSARITILVCVLFVVILEPLIHPLVARADITKEDIKAVNRGTEDYDPTDVCSLAGNSSPTSSGSQSQSQGDTFVNWTSGIKPPYIMEQYVIEVLKYIADYKKVPREDVVTREHTLALLAWAYGEGGDINNKSTFNLFNTSALRNDPSAMPYAAGGADGRLAYASFDIGIKATAGTMLLPRYSRVIDSLTKKETAAKDVLYAYSHYSKYPGNNWWAKQNEIDGEDKYYQGLLKFLNGFIKDYSRAATVIGTPAKEQQTGLKDVSKLTYSGAGLTQVSGGSVGSSINSGVCSQSSSGSKVADIAEQEFQGGANEADGSYLKYTEKHKEAWCGWFVSWVLKQAGTPFSDGSGSGGYAYPSVSAMHAMAIHKNIFHSKQSVVDGSFTPKAGDIAVYDEGVGSYKSHVNIVISYDPSAKTYVAIGGNEGNKVSKRTHSISSNSLTGFIRQ